MKLGCALDAWGPMVRRNVVIPDHLDKRFRNAVTAG